MRFRIEVILLAETAVPASRVSFFRKKVIFYRGILVNIPSYNFPVFGLLHNVFTTILIVSLKKYKTQTTLEVLVRVGAAHNYI